MDPEIDRFTAAHLHKWVVNNVAIGQEETERAMMRWIQEHPEDSELGWRKVFNRCFPERTWN